MLHFVYKDRRKVRRHNEWLHTRVSRGRKRAYLSGETVVVSTPHKCKSVVRRERGAERCLSLRSADLKMGVTDGAVAVLAFGLIFAYLMVPCRSADSTCSCSLLSMLEARFVNQCSVSRMP